ncbi:hypothetical protein MDA_GLEAN10003351 [Myotis davidii]|uniref:Uncharacterized protein n=1 Tax=Myotis davidii TaxID=225400 RepID=L5M749_MYODS|nr:hypothetical protein MDA_GLEAN10003351 [Myotis davidii]
MPAELVCRGCQFRAVAVPFPFLEQGHLHSWVHRVQILSRLALYSVEPVLEGAVLVCDSESRKPRKSPAKGSNRGRGPRAMAELAQQRPHPLRLGEEATEW